MSDSGKKGLIKVTRNIEEDVEYFRDYLEKKPARDKINRAENIHILIALAILSGFIGLYTADIVSRPSTDCISLQLSFQCVLAFHFIGALMFIPAKLASITVRPIWDPEYLQKFDELVLPGVHVFLLFGSIIPGTAVLFNVEPQFPYVGLGYLAIEFLVLILPTIAYARKYRETVQSLEIHTSDRRVLITGSGSGSSAELHLENPTDEDIAAEDIRFIIESPDGLEVWIEQASATNEEQTIFKPAHDLKSDSPRIFPIEMAPEGRGSVSEGVVKITVEIEGEKQSTEEISTRY